MNSLLIKYDDEERVFYIYRNDVCIFADRYDFLPKHPRDLVSLLNRVGMQTFKEEIR